MRKFFVVEIEMESAAMQHASNIVDALAAVSKQLHARYGKTLRPVDSRAIMDTNGLRVGSWNIEERHDSG